MGSLLRTLTALGVMSVVGAQSTLATLPSRSISAPDPLLLKQRDGTTSNVPVEVSSSPSVSDAPTGVASTGTPPNATGSVVPLAARLTGFDGCNDPKFLLDAPRFIIDAFNEFEKMVPFDRNSADNDNPPGTDQYPWKDPTWTSGPSVDFFGPMNRFSDYKDQVTANIDRLASFRTGWLTTWTLRVRCDDKLNQCPEKVDPPDDPCKPPGDGDPSKKKQSKLAYVATVDPYMDHMFFCPGFFLRPKLDDHIATVVNDLVQANYIDNYANRATTVAHELLHISWIGKPIDSPARDQLVDILMPSGNWKAYRSVDCKFLAHSEVEPAVQHVNNVNNYMYWFLANYIIHQYDFYPSGSTWLTTLDPPADPVSVANLAITNGTDVEIGWNDC